MAFDGAAWDEANPDNNDLANEIDDFMRDDKKAVSGRMRHEHVFPASQAATNEGGFHKFVTFQAQTAAPGLVYGTSTQLGAIWASSGSKNILIEDSAGNNYVLIKSGAGITFVGGTGNIGDIPYITSGGGVAVLAASASGLLLTAAGTTAAPTWAAASTLEGKTGTISLAAATTITVGGLSQTPKAVILIGAYSDTSGAQSGGGMSIWDGTNMYGWSMDARSGDASGRNYNTTSLRLYQDSNLRAEVTKGTFNSTGFTVVVSTATANYSCNYMVID